METMRVGVMAAVVGYGRSAMAVSVPALAAWDVNRAYAHGGAVQSSGGFKLFQMQDMTEQLERQIIHYDREHIDMDALMTGYLYNPRQQELAINFIGSQRRRSLRRVLIDPVMGDNGTPYTIVTPELMQGMRELVHYADMITPNLRGVLAAGAAIRHARTDARRCHGYGARAVSAGTAAGRRDQRADRERLGQLILRR